MDLKLIDELKEEFDDLEFVDQVSIHATLRKVLQGYPKLEEILHFIDYTNITDTDKIIKYLEETYCINTKRIHSVIVGDKNMRNKVDIISQGKVFQGWNNVDVVYWDNNQETLELLANKLVTANELTIVTKCKEIIGACAVLALMNMSKPIVYANTEMLDINILKLIRNIGS